MLIKDEHSMDPRSSWAWLEDRIRTARHRNTVNETHDNIVFDNYDFSKFGYRPWGGIPFVFSFGDCHQLPSVSSKTHFDPTPATGEANSACGQGKIIFEQFLQPLDNQEAIGVQVIMDEPMRQDNAEFLQMVQEMRSGNGLSNATCNLLMSRSIDKLPSHEQSLFHEKALFILPTWKDTVPIIKDYLIRLGTDICRIDAKVSKCNTKHMEEISFPLINAIAIGASVMLLTNFVVEEYLFNGSIGTIVDIVYADATGPRSKGSLPLYVVVNFPDVIIPPEKAWDRSNPTFVPIPVVKQFCEHRCCYVETLPLRVAKAITIDKSQGMTVGEGCVWEYLVVMLPPSNSQRAKTPGLAQVAITRVTSINRLALLSSVDNPLTMETLCRIGVGEATRKRNEFECQLRERSVSSQQPILDWILSEDTNSASPSFQGGYRSLVEWYRNLLPH